MHPSNTLVFSSVSCSYLYGMLPCLVRCSHINDRRVATLSNVVVGSTRLGPIMSSFLLLACMTLVSSLLISSSNVMLFFLSHSHSSSSLSSFKLPRRMASSNFLILFRKSSCPVPTTGSMVWGFFSVLPVSSHLVIVGPSDYWHAQVPISLSRLVDSDHDST